jgi:hypothetical protein
MSAEILFPIPERYSHSGKKHKQSRVSQEGSEIHLLFF